MPHLDQKPSAARRQGSARPGDRMLAKPPKPTQRERLVDAMIELSAQLGYQRVSVRQISSRAGVSRATFYEQFEDKEDCLAAAYRSATEQVLGGMRRVPVGDWSTTARAALRDVLGSLQSSPHAGMVVFVEARGASLRLRRQRERALDEVEERIEAALEHAPGGGETLDLPAIALIGAVRGIATWRLRTHGQDELPYLTEDLLLWMGSYAIPAESPRWSVSPDASLPASVAAELAPAPEAPVRLPRGRHGLPPGIVARSQRMRLIYGTADAMMAKGYAEATIADIVATAGVARDVFYAHFDDKLHAFLEAQRYATQEVSDALATAYFARETWPERVWSCLRTLVRLIVSHQSLSHLRLVECYAAGPAALSRAEDITRSFTVFLEEGFAYGSETGSVPRLSSEAITGAIFEVVYRHIARDDPAGLLRRLPQLAYIVLAPFTGREEAVRFVTEMSARHATPVTS